MSGCHGSWSAAAGYSSLKAQTCSSSSAALTPVLSGAAPATRGKRAGAGPQDGGQHSVKVCKKGRREEGSKLRPRSQIARVGVPAPSLRS